MTSLAAPAWTESDDRLPLSPAAAVRAARAFLEAMACPDAKKWELVEIALRPGAGIGQGGWVYIITFRQPFTVPSGLHVGSSLARLVEVPVLLDATVPKAIARRSPSRR